MTTFMGWLAGYERIPARNSGARHDVAPDTLVVHYTALSLEAEEQAKRWARAGAARQNGHFVIGRDGRVIQSVALNRVAYTQGGGSFLGVGRPNAMNRRSVSIELCNRGYAIPTEFPLDRTFIGRHRNPRTRSTRWEAYTEPQMEAFDRLLAIVAMAVPSLRYATGHEDVVNTWLTPGAKVDPGPAFPWPQFPWRRRGLVPMLFDFRIGKHVAHFMGVHGVHDET